MEIALGKGNFDVVFPEFPRNGDVDIGLYGIILLGIGDPYPELHIPR